MTNGSQLLVLEACDSLSRDASGFVQDVDIAHQTGIRLSEVRDCLEILANDELVSVARLQDHSYQASIVAKGRLFLSQRRRAPGEAKPKPIKVVPKGLRSFDDRDAEFFLELLPGQRRAGLPESIHFWKTRIEEMDTDKTFAVGVIFGLSGCGKSSLIKAGLLPRLADSVVPVYLEATGDDTEARLLKGLRMHVPGLPADLGLPDALSALRAGAASSPEKKVLIVLDQFEQWLHAKRAEEDTELAQALRQCDGRRVQAIVMVRDDFFTALRGFMGELGIALRQWENFAAVDLFDPRHARKVLTAFGQAFGALPDDLEKMTDRQREFLDRAISGLARDGRIIPVRLALFAEMIKRKDWTPETLREVGGTEGVGVIFLDETFGSTALKSHQKAARAVLKALLPESGSDIKGSMRSYRELLDVSGYASHPREFDDLIHVLDPELRLITPTDPEGLESEDQPNKPPGERYYQLTHDYLVQSLRDWLTRKQRETRRGRAEIRLAERSALWSVKPENRHLPSLVEWANIQLLTKRKDWTEPQKKMMKRAVWVHGLRMLGVVAGLLALLSIGIEIRLGVLESNAETVASGLVEQVVRANIAEVPAIVRSMGEYRRWVDPALRKVVGHSSERSSERLHASLALLPVDPSQVEYLHTRLLNANPTELPVIWKILKENHQTPVDRLWKVLADQRADDEKRFRAAWALASEDAAALEPRWVTVSEFVTNRFLASVLKNPSDYLPLIEILRPIRGRLLDPLTKIFVDEKKLESERSWATSILADYASDDPDRLADLLMEADLKTFGTLFEVVQKQGSSTVEKLQTEIKKIWKEADSEQQKEGLARRQARAAVALIRLRRADEDVWRLLKHSADPRLRSYIVNWLAPLKTNPQVLAAELESIPAVPKPTPGPGQQTMDAVLFHPETSMRRALILALGQYGEEELSPGDRKPLIDKLLAVYENDPDAGIHGAAEWILRRWGQQKLLEERDAAMRGKEPGEHRWYVNGQRQTFTLIEGPVKFRMGSPPNEPGHYENETPHSRVIPRRFAIAAKEVTVEQFQQFVQANPKHEQYGIAQNYLDQYSSPKRGGPMISVSWYAAAAYCNWLSQQEKIPETEWCYLPTKKESSQEGEGYEEGMTIPENVLERKGYRLPTQAEWEYACRAGAEVSRYYGLSEELLGQYAWYLTNTRGDRARPCGSLLPNDLGLFDMLGNVYEWCNGQYDVYPAGEGRVFDDNINVYESVKQAIPRLLRGGTFSNLPAGVRSAIRYGTLPSLRSISGGFRPARTYH